MAACSDAGPLGQMVVHPGPVVGYLLNGTLIPAWLGAGLSANLDDRIRDYYLTTLVPVRERHYGTDWTVR